MISRQGRGQGSSREGDLAVIVHTIAGEAPGQGRRTIANGPLPLKTGRLRRQQVGRGPDVLFHRKRIDGRAVGLQDRRQASEKDHGGHQHLDEGEPFTPSS